MPCRFKLYCPTVYIGTDPLTYVNTVKYLWFVFCENMKDDKDMLKQLRSFYAKSNKGIRMFNHCTVEVKLLLIKSYCTSISCGCLWSDYKFMSFTKLSAAFINVYRRVLGLPKWSSASEMYVVGFTQPPDSVSKTNIIIHVLSNTVYMGITFYINPFQISKPVIIQ